MILNRLGLYNIGVCGDLFVAGIALATTSFYAKSTQKLQLEGKRQI